MKKYNTTDLDPVSTFERHVFHRDQFAHYLRWSHIVKEAKIGETVVDFGCGKGNMLEVFYRNKFKCKRFVGIDIRKQTIEAAKEKFAPVDWAEFYADDLIFPTLDYKQYQADKVCSFEVAEHVGKQNIDLFLTNMRDCGNENATYYISTPNYDEQVGAAGNHTYDSGDGRGVAIHEFAHTELQGHIEKYFTIEKKFGTFASITHYKHLLNDWQVQMFEALKGYYDSNMLSVIMAPFFPEQSRNTLWVLKRK
jgi:cyclopropane fatty-acyl-phospholipid synthase-like methyltransferase